MYYPEIQSLPLCDDLLYLINTKIEVYCNINLKNTFYNFINSNKNIAYEINDYIFKQIESFIYKKYVINQTVRHRKPNNYMPHIYYEKLFFNEMEDIIRHLIIELINIENTHNIHNVNKLTTYLLNCKYKDTYYISTGCLHPDSLDIFVKAAANAGNAKRIIYFANRGAGVIWLYYVNFRNQTDDYLQAISDLLFKYNIIIDDNERIADLLAEQTRRDILEEFKALDMQYEEEHAGYHMASDSSSEEECACGRGCRI